MDFMVETETGDIMIEPKDQSTEQRNRLLQYYSAILAEGGSEVSEKKERVLQHIAFSMSEKDAQDQNDRIEAMRKRLMAYYKAWKIIALRLSGTVQMNSTREIFITRVAYIHT